MLSILRPLGKVHPWVEMTWSTLLPVPLRILQRKVRGSPALSCCNIMISCQNRATPSGFAAPSMRVSRERQLRVSSLPSPLHLLPASCCPRLPGAVPTAPPQNVQVEAVNSTTIQFLWNPPPQQFINGINQGYKVRLGPQPVRGRPSPHLTPHPSSPSYDREGAPRTSFHQEPTASSYR